MNKTNQPALVPMFGGMDNRPRPLDRDVITIGRAKGCDIGLEAPEVSALHCLLYRIPEGYRVRDCGSRTGTRVNGDPPRHHVLAEGDVLQIGPFSFTVSIPPGARSDERKLDVRRLAHCQRSRRHLAELALQLRRRRAEQSQHRHQGVLDLQREREEFMSSKEEWVAQQAETSAALEKQRAALEQAEAALRERRAELARMMTELGELQNAIKKQQAADVQSLTQENEELRRMLLECERRLGAVKDDPSASPANGVEELKSENELLRQMLQEKDAAAEELRQQVAQLKNQPQANPEAPAAPAPIVDVDSFEAELNQYRQQLELDRAKLNKEIEQVRSRNEELDDATREMEMAMSRERAELARERMRLDRMREEVRSELERVQRDAGMRESLAPVNKLREEISQKKGGSDRLRSAGNVPS